MTCACKPGTPENGWHELRCEECEKAHRLMWSLFLQGLGFPSEEAPQRSQPEREHGADE